MTTKKEEIIIQDGTESEIVAKVRQVREDFLKGNRNRVTIKAAEIWN